MKKNKNRGQTPAGTSPPTSNLIMLQSIPAVPSPSHLRSPHSNHPNLPKKGAIHPCRESNASGFLARSTMSRQGESASQIFFTILRTTRCTSTPSSRPKRNIRSIYMHTASCPTTRTSRSKPPKQTSAVSCTISIPFTPFT